MSDLNPSRPATLGLEWLTADPVGAAVIAAAGDTYGVAFPKDQGETLTSMSVYAVASGNGVFGGELYATPYTPPGVQVTTVLPGTDTNADYSSPYNGGNAWVNESGGAAGFSKITSGNDDVNYLRNNTNGELPNNGARMLVRGNTSIALAGARVLSVEVRCRVKTTMSGTPLFTGALKLSGNIYNGTTAAIPINAGYSDVSLGTWALNPRTGRPWVLSDVNNFIASTGTDTWGLTAWWLFQDTNTLRVSQLYLVVRWVPEDRVGYGWVAVANNFKGWKAIAAQSVPNLLAPTQAWGASVTGSTGWASAGNCTVTNQADRPAGWSASTSAMQMSSTAAGDATAHLATRIPVIPGKVYGFDAAAKLNQPMSSLLVFYDVDGNNLGNGDTIGYATVGFIQLINNTWVDVVECDPVAAPANAATVDVTVTFTASAGGQTCRIAGGVLCIDFAATTLYAGGTIPATTAPNGGVEQSYIQTVSYSDDYALMFVLRRLSGNGSVTVPTFTPGDGPIGMPREWTSYRPVLADVSGRLAAVGDAASDTMPLILTTGAGTSVDSQSYASRRTFRVDSANTIKQEFTPHGSVTGQLIRLVVAGQTDPIAGAMTVKIKRVSDNVQIGGTATIAATDLAQLVPAGGTIASRTTPQVFIVKMASGGALVSGTQYYFEFASAAGAWFVYALDDLGQGDAATFGGTIDAATDPLSGGRVTRRDVMATISTVPTTPGGFAGSVNAVGRYNSLTWTATSLSTLFDAYEVWRSEDAGVTFRQIADLSLEAGSAFKDYEFLRVAAGAIYKVRVRRTDGAVSDFTANTGALAQILTSGRYLFATNEVSGGGPALEVYDDPGNSGRKYSFRERSQTFEFFGRPGSVTFKATEDEGDEFTIDVLLYCEGSFASGKLGVPTGSLIGRAAFEAIRSLSRQSVSYVTVHDSDGNRWFASISVPEGTRSEPGQEYMVPVIVREGGSTPSTPTTSP